MQRPRWVGNVRNGWKADISPDSVWRFPPGAFAIVTDPVLTKPSALRLAAAFVVAPILPAAVVAAYISQESYHGYFLNSLVLVLLFGAYPGAIFLGGPAYLVLRQRIRPSALACALAGGMVAAIPWLAIGVFGGPDQASVDDKLTVSNGVLTVFGWLELLRFVSVTFVLGAVGGFVFWAIAGSVPSRR